MAVFPVPGFPARRMALPPIFDVLVELHREQVVDQLSLCSATKNIFKKVRFSKSNQSK
jgi:hypothetical protein